MKIILMCIHISRNECVMSEKLDQLEGINSHYLIAYILEPPP
jgi:hypothetical protein